MFLPIAVGCIPNAAAPASFDAQLARETLRTALEAWKQKQTRSLTTRQPPIRFVDDDLVAGCTLTDYELGEPDLTIGAFQSIPVTLVLRDRRGMTTRRAASYQVTLNPSLAVLRSNL